MKIPEAATSPALVELLKRAAGATAPVFTIGCDLGRHRDSSKKLRRPEVAGGYVQVAERDFAAAEADDYWRLAEVIHSVLRRHARGQYWRVVFLLKGCQFRLGREPEVIAPSLMTWFWARAATPEGARESRELLLDRLTTALLLEPAAGL